MIIHGFHQGKTNAARCKQIKAFCKKKNLAEPDFEAEDYMQAIAKMHMCSEECALVGAIADIVPPEPYKDAPDYEWKEVFFNYIEDTGTSFYPIDVDTYSNDDIDIQHSISTIRSFNRSCKDFKQHIRLLNQQDLGAPYAFGRPPYGYDIIDGKLSINKYQARAVRAIFTQHTKGKGIPDIIDMLRDRYGRIPKRRADHTWLKTTKKEKWDYTRVKRIISKEDLYCKGVYSAGNTTIQLSEIILFNPKS